MIIPGGYTTQFLRPGLKADFEAIMFTNPYKCQSKLWVKKEDEWIFHLCKQSYGHVGSHRCYIRLEPKGLWISWSDFDSANSWRQKEADENKVEKVTGQIFGWRCWRFGYNVPNCEVDDLNLLHSTAKNIPWTSPVMTTKVDTEGVPLRPFSKNHIQEPLKDFGVYCYKTLQGLKSHFDFLYRLETPRPAGRVEVKLGAVEHEIGYRARMLVIQELFVCKDTFHQSNISEYLEYTYQCPVTVFKTEKAFFDWMDYTIQEEMENG